MYSTIRHRKDFTTPDSFSNLSNDFEYTSDDSVSAEGDVAIAQKRGQSKTTKKDSYEGEAFVTKHSYTQNMPFFQFKKMCLGLLLVLSILGISCFFFKRFWTENPQQLFAQLKSKFPEQNSSLWGVIASAISSAEYSRFAKDQPPTILLLVPRLITDEHKSSTSLYSPLPSQFAAFVHQLERVLISLSDNDECVIINLTFSELHSTPKLTLAKRLHNLIADEYRTGRRCFSIIGIDKLPGEVVIGLHGTTDLKNSPYRNSFFLLTLSRSPLSTLINFSRREVEKSVRKFLHTLWDSSLGVEVVAALVSRLTGRIGIFQ